MKLLLDTCAFLWAADAPERLSNAARTAVAARENDVLGNRPTRDVPRRRHRGGRNRAG